MSPDQLNYTETQLFFDSSPLLAMVTCFLGLPEPLPSPSIFFTRSMPSRTINTIYMHLKLKTSADQICIRIMYTELHTCLPRSVSKQDQHRQELLPCISGKIDEQDDEQKQRPTSAKDCVLAIQPGGDDSCDEKLAAIGVWSSIGHAQQASNIMLQVEVLVLQRAVYLAC